MIHLLSWDFISSQYSYPLYVGDMEHAVYFNGQFEVHCNKQAIGTHGCYVVTFLDLSCNVIWNNQLQ